MQALVQNIIEQVIKIVRPINEVKMIISASANVNYKKGFPSAVR